MKSYHAGFVDNAGPHVIAPHCKGAVSLVSFLEVVLMVMSWLHRMWRKKSGRVSRPGRKRPNSGRFLPAFEALDERILPAVAASFSTGTGILTVVGDAQDNTIV